MNVKMQIWTPVTNTRTVKMFPERTSARALKVSLVTAKNVKVRIISDSYYVIFSLFKH